MSTYHTFRAFFSRSSPERLHILHTEMTARLDSIDRLATQIKAMCADPQTDLPADFETLAEMTLGAIARIGDVMPFYRLPPEELSDDHLQMFRHDIIVPIQSIHTASFILQHIAQTHRTLVDEACDSAVQQLTQIGDEMMAIIEALTNPKDFAL